MQIFYSATSPFVRKVMVLAIELGIADQLEHLPSAVHPVDRDAGVVEKNPLGQVPTLLTDDGLALFDSSVICQYLDSLDGGGKFLPPSGNARWTALRDEALADGLMNAGLLVRYESTLRPEDKRNAGWTQGQTQKITASLAAIEKNADAIAGRFDIGVVAMACALGYVDFRFAELNWRETCPRTARWFETVNGRPSFQQTAPR